MKETIIDFVERNKDANITRKILTKMRRTIDNLSVWRLETSSRNEEYNISNDTAYTIINFYNTFVENFAILFPNIILNKVDYNNIFLPKHLKITPSHEEKIKKSIREYYSSLNSLYGVNGLNSVLTQIQKSCKGLLTLSKNTPCLSSTKYGQKIVHPVLDERTSMLLHEYYLLRIMIAYIELSDNPDMIVTEVEREVDINDIFTLEYLEEVDTRKYVVVTSETKEQYSLFAGNKKELKQKVAKLLIQFIQIMDGYKDTIDIPYEEILDIIFKLKEREKNDFTDRLKNMTDEQRDADTALKINKLGMYNKGARIMEYDEDLYEEEREFRDKMERTAKEIRRKNTGITDDDIDNMDLINDYLDEERKDEEIDQEAYDMEYLNEDFYEGKTDGEGAPEEEYDDYADYDS
jgi:hypothetical protein